MAAKGRYRPVAAISGFSNWQPAMLARPAGFGQVPSFIRLCRRSFNEVFPLNPMRLKSIFLVAFIIPGMSFAGGTLSTNELDSLMGQMPAVRDLLRSNLRLSESAYAAVRFGPDFINLSGARMGPYTIDARSTKDGKPLVVVLCTSARFLDERGRKLPDVRITQAASIEEKLTGVILRQESVDTAQPPC